MHEPASWKRLCWASVALMALMLIYLNQRYSYMGSLASFFDFHFGENTIYAGNKIIRFLLNDACAIALIYALFYERKYVLFAFAVQMFGFVCFMIPYLFIKLYWKIEDGPMISFLHRLIVNPTLLLLLIPALWVQRKNSKS